MKTILAIFVTIFLATEIQSQVVTGKIVDENGDGLQSISLQLYVNPYIYNTTTTSDGSFIFNIVTGVEEGQLPAGYAVSNNFPNPFNPTTRIGITLPVREDVKIEVFNLLGQEVKKPIEQTCEAGTNFIDIELNGLANGVYAARVTIGDKHIFVKKMMLVYGSRHLAISGAILNTELYKSNNTDLETNLDSLVAINLIIGRKTFLQLPSISGEMLDLGNLTIERYCPSISSVTYGGKSYKTIQIGNQCWLKENLDIGTMINGSGEQTDNGMIEKYCYDDNPSNCENYGGLYQWDEAMQYVTTPSAQGICPSGWHLPTFAEFQTLGATVGGNSNAIKAMGQGWEQGTGTNTSGFSALLAGYRHPDGSYYFLSSDAYFWSSTEYYSPNAYSMRLIGYSHELFPDGYINVGKKYGQSVRCLKNEFANSPPEIPSNPSPTDNEMSVFISLDLTWNCSDIDEDTLTYDVYFGTDAPPLTKVDSNLTSSSLRKIGLSENTLYYWRVVAKDRHDNFTSGPVWRFTTGGPYGLPCPSTPTVEYLGKTYNTVQIGEQCWIKENLDVGSMINASENQSDNDTIEKYCFNDDPSNCNVYGGLYQWDETMQYATLWGAQGICPEGWHIPTITEFEYLQELIRDGGNALKEIGQGTGDGAGTNITGFSALFSGIRLMNGSFSDLLNFGLWTSSEYDASNAEYFSLSKNISHINYGHYYKNTGFNVRCLKDGNIPVYAPCPGTPNVEYGSKTYNTVQIENQCWLKENLDVGTMILGSDTAKDNGIIEKYCYDNNLAKCNRYGGLYQWNEAMQYSTIPGTQGLCPPGWHIPTYAEFQILITAVGGDGNALKEIGQGDSTEWWNGKGTNTSGFSAFLAGYRYETGGFDHFSQFADIWSSTEYDSSQPYGMMMNTYWGSVDVYQSYDEFGFSVRCIKDSVITQNIPCPGTPTVEYEGKTYNTVQIGNQCWLKENLDIGTMIQESDTLKDNGIIEKYCYENDTANCSMYGGLYQWWEVMQYTTIEGTRGICPQGWHIPTYSEFQTLSTTVGGDGNALKAIGQGTGDGAGTNTSGFSALFSGLRLNGGDFYSLGYYTYFWSSTSNGAYMAVNLFLFSDDNVIYYTSASKLDGCSVRCLKD